MHFTERLQVPVSLEDTWEFIWQAPRLAACLPGCTGVEEVEPGKRYLAHISDSLGPYRVQFDLRVSIVESVEKERVRLLATGRDTRVGIDQRIDLEVRLRELGPSSTAIRVDADVEVTGAVARFGQFLIRPKAQDIIRRFTRNIEAELRRV